MAKTPTHGIETFPEIKELGFLSVEELRARWTQIFKRPLPPSSQRDFLLGSLAYELQSRVHGHLKTSSHRALCAMVKDLSCGSSVQNLVGTIRPGARLLRTWQGKTHEVLALEKGFLYRGVTYSSLSEIARAITGVRWSGPLFFGLKKSLLKKPKPPVGEKA